MSKMKYYLSRSLLFVMLIVFISTMFVLEAQAVTITTNAATGVTTNSVTFNGHTDTAGTVWFEYSGVSGKYMFKTSDQTASGVTDFTDTVTGMPLISHTTYYYRAVGSVAGVMYVGAEQSFTTSDLTTLVNYSFDNHTQELIDAKFDPLQLSNVTSKPYTDIIGVIFWGIVFGFIFIMIWLRQENVTVPAIVGMIIGLSMWASMPPEFVKIAYSLTIVSFFAIVYTLIKSRL